LIGIRCPVSEVRELSQAPVDAQIEIRGALSYLTAAID
jgi:hypothetical protein